ncbi:MAG: S9 family peptidase [Saprospiraceae bacterium]|nr:S9 family peptidase [Saprospiraceae bacterium]
MYKFLPIILLLLIFACSKTKDMTVKEETSLMKYPKTAGGAVVDTYFGTNVADPYRWLEDDRSKETDVWVDAQNNVTFEYLNKIPFRAAYKARLEKLWNYEKFSAPFKEGEFTYFYKNNGLQNQFVLWREKKGMAADVFLDPNTFSKDGTTSLAGINFSKDGSKVAYQISEGGSDWRKVIIMDAISKKILEDTLFDVKFSGLSWKGNEGFYYSSYDKPKGSELSAKTDQHKLYYHKLGTKQKEDKVIFGDNIKRRYVGGNVSDDDRYLFITASNATYGNELYMLDLKDTNSKLITIQDHFNNDTDVIENDGTKLYIFTDVNAPNRKVVSVEASSPKADNWKDFIPETENVLNISTGCGYFFASYMKDALSLVKQYDYSGKFVRDLVLPGVGTASIGGAKKSEMEMFFSFTNYITPGSIYKFNPASGESKVFVKPNIDFDPSKYESKQVFYNSKDGTKVPMIITHKKGLKLDGTNPTILYGYGGFNISLTPSFSIGNAVWLEQGGIYAVPNLRGGGEYGKKWHVAGTQLQKQNVFDDFISAAEYLIKNKYTSSSNLAISGGSNGGLLVGACLTQRPELFKVALPAVGVLDMLRYHTFTAGAGWAFDYGTAEQSEEMFKYLKNYSPVHNVKKGVHYPATMVTTADHDDRVVPAHSYKFIAELQKNHVGANPVLIRIDKSAGHGAGKPTSKTIEEATDRYCFALYNMGKSFVNPNTK